MKASGGMFELLEPSKAKKKGVHGKYNGVHDVKILFYRKSHYRPGIPGK